MRAALIVVLALGLVYQVSSECANACSGHGVCRNSDQCDCFPNYMAADCSQRVCPYGQAWVDNPRGDLNHDGARDLSAVPIFSFTNGDSATVGTNPYPENVIEYESGIHFNAQPNEGHYYAECSNKGLCDRSAGLCTCFDGYTGSSCQRTTCPNDCSGHGVCRTVQETAAGDSPNSVAAGSNIFETTAYGGLNKRELDNKAGYVFYEGVVTSTLYRLWDADMAQTCICDPGYAGADCSRRECPRGDDPLTHRYADCPLPQGYGHNAGGGSNAVTVDTCVDEIQVFDLTGASTDVDWVHFLFRDWTGKIWKTDDILIGASGAAACGNLPVAISTAAIEDAVTAALQGIPNKVIGSVDVTATSAAGVVTLTITFTGNPGNLPNLEIVNSANMQLNLPLCKDTTANFVVTMDTSAATGSKDGNKELSTCSNRGICDYDSGLCKCFKGYYGGDCSMQNALSQ